ncbi:MAG: response regulator [Gammaproteobacteria bacterium]|nr:response regulator [Gammaproteobacteria bacterium]
MAKGFAVLKEDALQLGRLDPFLGKKVIVADDDSFIREALRMILREKKIEILSEVANGQKVLEAVRYQKADYLFLDINMPGMNGLEVLKQLVDEQIKVKVIMISGSATKEAVKTALELGAVGFVVKPFNPAAVYKTLERANIAAGTKPAQ